MRYINSNLKIYSSCFYDSFWKWVEVGPDGESSHSMNQWSWWFFKIKIDSCLQSRKEYSKSWLNIVMLVRKVDSKLDSFTLESYCFIWSVRSFRHLKGLSLILRPSHVCKTLPEVCRGWRQWSVRRLPSTSGLWTVATIFHRWGLRPGWTRGEVFFNFRGVHPKKLT